jgi:hypothetical protein
MGKYLKLQEDIFSIFNGTPWKAEQIKTYPANFTLVGAGNEFIRVSIVASEFGINLNSTAGILLIDIFISAGNGPRQISLIADKLDLYLVGKSVETQLGYVTQFSNSSLDMRGLDRDNPSLFRAVYTIPFNYFGVNTQ